MCFALRKHRLLCDVGLPGLCSGKMLNDYILQHNSALNNNRVLYFQLIETDTRKVYEVFHELGTLVVMAYMGRNKKETQFALETPQKAYNKALGLIRDKYVEGSRILMPTRYQRDSVFKAFSALSHNEQPTFEAGYALYSLFSTQGYLYPLFKVIGEVDKHEVFAE